MELNKIVQNTRLAGGFAPLTPRNEPAEYSGKRYPYYEIITARHKEKMLKYASDFADAEIEFPDENGNLVWVAERIRMANVVRPTSAIQRNFDDYKIITPENPDIGYLQIGAKVRACGSVWLVVNPDNISGGEGTAIVRRCNAAWNHLDYYGNVVSEPIVVENARANASNPDAQTDQQIASGYYNVTCQYNEFTRQANDNTRIILGDDGNPHENAKAYRITGYGNFFREFTEDSGSVRLLTFSIRVQTKAEDSDDLVRCVADGKNFSWNLRISGPASVSEDGSAVFSASSMRNGTTVVSTDENPVSYVWKVSDAETATITQDGTLHGVKPGTVTVTAYLEQNPSVYANVSVTVTSGFSRENALRFVGPVPDVMGPLDTAVLEAKYFENGREVPADIEYSFSGADENTYSHGQTRGGVVVVCYGYSEAPLRVTATYDRYQTEIEISLEDV